MENYFTAFPLGVYYAGFLGGCRNKRKRNTTTRVYYRGLEKEIFQNITELGGKPIRTSHRVKDEGRSEWIHCSNAMIAQSLRNAEKIYGGKLSLFHTKDVNRSK